MYIHFLDNVNIHLCLNGTVYQNVNTVYGPTWNAYGFETIFLRRLRFLVGDDILLHLRRNSFERIYFIYIFSSDHLLAATIFSESFELRLSQMLVAHSTQFQRAGQGCATKQPA